MYLECSVIANPWVTGVSWLFEGEPLTTDLLEGIIVANQSLVVQKVKRRHSGRYSCTATNKEGQGESEEFFLKINCKDSSSLYWSNTNCISNCSYQQSSRCIVIWLPFPFSSPFPFLLTSYLIYIYSSTSLFSFPFSSPYSYSSSSTVHTPNHTAVTPVCKSGQKIIYGVAMNELVNIVCDVEAEPAPHLFKWSLNASSENIEVRSFVSNGSQSVATYAPRTRFGYGALTCWASNEIGAIACVYNIVPASKFQLLSPMPKTSRSIVDRDRDGDHLSSLLTTGHTHTHTHTDFGPASSRPSSTL